MEQQQHAGKLRIQKMMDTFGCIPSIQPMTALERFTPLEMAQAIEQNLNEAAMYGNTKITIHLDLPDAHLLAQYLRSK